MAKVKPIVAFARGIAAGLAGSWAINQFFRYTQGIAPSLPENAFEPPEERQRSEGPSATVGRRVVEDLAQRGPLSPEEARRAGRVVNYAFGGAWGGVYGLARESYPAVAGPLGAVGFGGAVGLLSGVLILPTFRLGPSVTRTPLSSHAYNLASHVWYGLATEAVYAVLVRRPWLPVAAYFGLRGPLRKAFVRARVQGTLAGVKFVGKGVRYGPTRRAMRAVAPYAARVGL